MTYLTLDPQKIIETVEALQRRIEERFPGSGLGRVAGELASVANQAAERSLEIWKPNLLLRGVALLLCFGFVAILAGSLASMRLRPEDPTLSDLIQDIDALIASAVFLGAAVVFLLSVDTRLKRRRVLSALRDLRSIAHIVDMHQLTKDPEVVSSDQPATTSSPKRTMTPFEISRYLDYSSEMLSLTSKIAALYVQGFEDPVALTAVDELENLTTGLSRKIWQKIMIIDRILRPAE